MAKRFVKVARVCHARRCHDICLTRDHRSTCRQCIFVLTARSIPCSDCSLTSRLSLNNDTYTYFTLNTYSTLKERDSSNPLVSVVLSTPRRFLPAHSPILTYTLVTRRGCSSGKQAPIDSGFVVVSLREYVHPSARRECSGSRLSLRSRSAHSFSFTPEDLVREEVCRFTADRRLEE